MKQVYCDKDPRNPDCKYWVFLHGKRFDITEGQATNLIMLDNWEFKVVEKPNK